MSARVGARVWATGPRVCSHCDEAAGLPRATTLAASTHATTLTASTHALAHLTKRCCDGSSFASHARSAALGPQPSSRM